MRFRKPSKKEILRDGKNFLAGAVLCGLFLCAASYFFGGSCWLRLSTGFPCPACGFTRACLLLLKGDVAGAWQMHAMVFPVLFGIPVFLFSKYFLENGRNIWKWYGIILCIVAVCYYIWRMIHYFPHTEPVIYYSRNLLAELLHKVH